MSSPKVIVQMMKELRKMTKDQTLEIGDSVDHNLKLDMFSSLELWPASKEDKWMGIFHHDTPGECIRSLFLLDIVLPIKDQEADAKVLEVIADPDDNVLEVLVRSLTDIITANHLGSFQDSTKNLFLCSGQQPLSVVLSICNSEDSSPKSEKQLSPAAKEVSVSPKKQEEKTTPSLNNATQNIVDKPKKCTIDTKKRKHDDSTDDDDELDPDARQEEIQQCSAAVVKNVLQIMSEDVSFISSKRGLKVVHVISKVVAQTLKTFKEMEKLSDQEFGACAKNIEQDLKIILKTLIDSSMPEEHQAKKAKESEQ